MKVKVDYSPEAKALGSEKSIPGRYAIYYKKNIFHKWKQLDQTYADIDIAIIEAKRFKEEFKSRKRRVPIYI